MHKQQVPWGSHHTGYCTHMFAEPSGQINAKYTREGGSPPRQGRCRWDEGQVETTSIRVGIIHPPARTPGAGWALAATTGCTEDAGCQARPVHGKPALLGCLRGFEVPESVLEFAVCIKKI